ncbi:BTB/POZ domain [Trinorchestia longiramus]|nr:BTB/POZ domain [Trinorchestia longiramus]
MSPEFCLRWNNHRPNLVNVFKELLHHEVLVDVTLAAEGQFIHAHRLVLSACSLYFKELFAVNPCQHPIVILKDFHIADLKTVVEFIYQGEVNVAQERLPNVLKTAESLRIKGLAENPRTFEDYQQQQQQQQQTGNSSATPRLGSQSSQQQSSSLSDSLDQQSVEGEEGAPTSPHSPVPPPHKRKRVHAAYEHHDTSTSVPALAGAGSEGVRVKEEPVSGNGHQRHATAAASDAPQGGGAESESTNNNRDSPSDKSGGGGGSPTPPPPLSLTPSLSSVSMAPVDAAPAALTPPDCSGPLSQQQGKHCVLCVCLVSISSSMSLFVALSPKNVPHEDQSQQQLVAEFELSVAKVHIV